MNNLIAVLLLSFTSLVFASNHSAPAVVVTPPAKATEKPKVLKPCKQGQSAEKDNCHEVKAATKKK